MGAGGSAAWLPGLAELLAAAPADLAPQLRPLLRLRTEQLQAAFEAFREQERLSLSDVAEQLQLDQKAARVLLAGQSHVQSFDLMMLLVIVSRTHLCTKVRLICFMWRLDFGAFRQIVSSFLWAVGRLSGTRRSEALSEPLVESLAFCLFRPHDPEMPQEAFLKLASCHAGGFLRRFSRGPDEVCVLGLWPRRPREAPAAKKPPGFRKGYFLAVPSAKEVALSVELEQIKLERSKPLDKLAVNTLDLEIREQAIQAELAVEAKDVFARREYRRRLQKVWHRSRPNSAHCRRQRVLQGRLWTASSSHLARGGVLPCNITRPITPVEVQAAVNSVVSSTSQPSRTINQRVLQEFETTLAERPRHSTEELAGSENSGCKDEERCLFKHAEVLAAFDLYRSDYWLKEGGGIRSLLKAGLPTQQPKHMSSADIAHRRKVEIELMLREVAEEKPSSQTPSASQELTLRGFLKAVFPLAKVSDIKIMLQWIKRPPSESNANRSAHAGKADLGLLRELIDLFDAIDGEHTGLVPIEAVERFLSGEIVTQGESARLKRRQENRTGQRSVTNFATYPNNPRAALILNKTLEDQPEWQVAVPDFKGKRHANRSLEHRMEALAHALDTELHALAHGDAVLLSETIEARGGCGWCGSTGATWWAVRWCSSCGGTPPGWSSRTTS
ncbi:unnamed protein product [Effrenium voratum]|uniref:EF-hand domain-containing protein n=1 Tax=Effrenium voratum TaxID=2562239 RepID=A0AA36J268_9DINO|nr:unnamed protein product [Effrenium voratum]